MTFKKKWSDEQNERLLELHKRVSNKEIAKEFNITPTNVSKRISYLKKLNKKQKKKKVNFPLVKKNYKSDQKEISKTSKPEKRIEVLTAPLHDNADELMKDYQTNPINQEEPEEETPEILENEEPMSESRKVKWTGVSNSLTLILDKRFIANKLAPLTEDEKTHLSKTLNEVLELRAEFFFKYADLVSLGIAGFSIMTPRLLEFFDRKKKETTSSEANKDLTIKEIPQAPPVIDEQAEAQKRYAEAMEKVHG